MSVLLDCLRHGETELGGGFRGWLDDALTDTGWQQMTQAVQVGRDWQRIVSSPLQRCARFAERLAGELGISLELEPDLRELHFGQWEGLSGAQVWHQAPQALEAFWADPDANPPPGGESLRVFSERVQAAVARLQPRYDGERVLLVTHGGVIRLLLALARGLPQRELLSIEVPHAARIALSRAADGSLSEVR